MSSSIRRQKTTLVLIASTMVAASLMLTGCGNVNPVPATPTSSPEPTTPAPIPVTTTIPVAGVPLKLTCNDVLSPEALYALKGGANFSNNPSFTPANGSAGSEIAALGGITCGYTNETSGDTFSVSVAEITSESMPSLKEQLSTKFSNQVVASFSPTDAFKGYFAVSNGVGDAQIATSKYWVSISSTIFGEAGDVQQLVDSIETTLGR
jgi:hypothetical protein